MKSFLRWIESEEAAGVSEPQHKKGEANMRIKELAEKRIKSMMFDFKNMGKGSDKDILEAIMAAVQEMLGKDDSQEGSQEQPQQGQTNQLQEPQNPQPQMPQMPQMS